MKILFSILLSFILATSATAQTLHIDSTRFITGYDPGTGINFAIPTEDKGILFVGYEYGTPGGIIPAFSYANDNVMIGKIDSNQKISWIKIYGGNGDEEAFSACQTSNGGYAVLAATMSNDGDVTGYLGNGDLWLLSLDASGNLLWGKCYGSTQSDEPLSVANTPDHGFILFGTTNGSDHDVPHHYGGFFTMDWLVIKTDSSGHVQWSKDLGGSSDEGGGSILAVDSSYYLVSTSNSTDHDCTNNAWHPLVNTGSDCYILKLDDTGKVLWDSSYGGGQEDAAQYAMYDTRDSSMVVVGNTNSNDYMVSGLHGSPGGNDDVWIVKVNKSGKLLWQKTLGDSQRDNGTGICALSADGYLVSGKVYPGPMGAGDYWLFVLDSSGHEMSNKIFGGTYVEQDNISILPYLSGYAALGNSYSLVFTEGSTYGNFDTSNVNPDGGGGFVSYIDSATLSTKDIVGKNEQLKIYPNPTDGNVTICLPANIGGTLIVTNTLGEVMYTASMQKERVGVNVREWTNGIYIVKWQNEEGYVEVKKLIKN